ncbi:MAG: DUF1080 domain-containing protein [Armatimonadetes bacterium]|nr:DUF1080 domain-containing protein [Armatimonadota bacterium]
MRQWRFLLGALGVAIFLPMAALAQKPVSLIGKDLTGWVQRGGNAKYWIEGNEIVGSCVLNTQNSFLCTERTYGDFILEYDFKVDPRLNSGVQIRSECFDQKSQVEWRGKTINVPAKRVHGYQIEIDPDPTRDRWWSGGIYDEARRDWLYPGQLGGDPKVFTDTGRKMFKQGDWNHVKVEAIGDSIKTWFNGKPCAAIKDSMTLRGLIALQVHTIGNDKSKEGAEVRWRNLKITDLSPKDNTITKEEKAAGWQLLWDGKTTKGWRGAKLDTFPAKGWVIKDGVLTVLASGGAEGGAGGDIVTTQRYSQFELTVDFKITEGANSGVKYFCQPNLDPITGTGAKAATGSAIGLEFQILDDEHHPDAKLGRDGDRTVGSLYDLISADKSKLTNPVGSWNTARILVQGSHVEHWLNGKKVLEYERGSSEFRALVAESKYKNIPGFGEWPDGHILLQDHGNQVSFKNVKIRVIH